MLIRGSAPGTLPHTQNVRNCPQTPLKPREILGFGVRDCLSTSSGVRTKCSMGACAFVTPSSSKLWSMTHRQRSKGALVGNKAKHRVAISDDPFLLLDRELVPPIQVMKVLLHDHITSAGEPRVLLADDGRVASWLIDGFSVPSTKPIRSRSSKYLKPWTSSAADTASRSRDMIWVASSKQRSISIARI